LQMNYHWRNINKYMDKIKEKYYMSLSP